MLHAAQYCIHPRFASVAASGIVYRKFGGGPFHVPRTVLRFCKPEQFSWFAVVVVDKGSYHEPNTFELYFVFYPPWMLTNLWKKDG